MSEDHNLILVVISIIIAIVTSYSALNITLKITNATKENKPFWLVSGSIVMGAGVWAMHFIGMIAHESHAMVEYNISITIISMFASVLSAFLAFYITMQQTIKSSHIVIGGIVMGSGIAAMHYIGMEAIIMDGETIYDPALVTLSVIIALVSSYISLLLFSRFKLKREKSWLKWGSSIVMGIAISGMHYVGMSATTMELSNTHTADTIDLFLLIGVLVTIATIILILWVAIFFDRYVLSKMAYLDNITGLSNRNDMNRFLNKLDPSRIISLIFIDLDQFKTINDTLGHEIGDLLLREVGQFLKTFESHQLIRVFRVGGDEFLFALNHSDFKQAEALAVDLLQQIKKPFHIDGNELYITGSIGIAVGSVEESNHSKLLRAADTAMYVAKKNGRNQYCVYTKEMGQKEVRKMRLEKDLQLALEEKQFHLEYQPKWNVQTDSLFGFEALARWNHPELGPIFPGEFIPTAEETGFIVPFTAWTLEQACQHCKILHEKGIIQPVSVNISPKLFQTNRLYELVSHVLKTFDLDPSYLELEITESMMLHNVDDIVRQLKRIHSLGVRVSMDDFGTGYSSIGLLDTLPIDTVKLDRIFTKDIDKPSKQAIIRAIIILAESLGLDVIAEGVESKEDIGHLTDLGCYIMQGYYYSKPMKFETIEAWTKLVQENNLLDVKMKG